VSESHNNYFASALFRKVGRYRCGDADVGNGQAGAVGQLRAGGDHHLFRTDGVSVFPSVANCWLVPRAYL
jgi:hypothetical protein